MESSLLQSKQFLFDSYLFSCQSRILNSVSDESGNLKIKLDKTVFHPQGGGQPSDTGFICQGDRRFQVSSLEIDKSDDSIWHVGKCIEDFQFDTSVDVTAEIDESQRRLYARIHSAGHLIDLAVQRLGYQLSPGKGFHFPKGAYVEYIGNIPNEERDQALALITQTCQRIIQDTQEGSDVRVYEYEEAKGIIEVPDYLPAGRPIRFVKLSNEDRGCPCGGTHVKHVREIGTVMITKLQKKGKAIRVSYEVSN